MRKIADQDSNPPEESVSETAVAGRRRIPRWAIVVVVCFLVLLGVGTARHVYLGWKERQLIRAARYYLNENNSQALRRILDEVLQINPNNLEAFRVSAQALLKEGNSKAMPWLRRAVELAPDNVDDQMALAEAALRFGQTQEAAKAVQDIQAKASGRADYHDLAGRVAQAMGQNAEAESHFAEAVRLAPDDKAYRLRLTVLQLKSSEDAVRDAARTQALQLAGEGALRVTALRALIVDAVKGMQIDRAFSLAGELNAEPGHSFSDRLLYLEVSRLANDPEFHTHLAEVEEEAAQNAGNVLPLLSWMNSSNLTLFARDWVRKLPPEKVATTGIRLEMARSYALFGDWKRLRFFLAEEQWGELDYIRRAFLAKCYQELENSDTNFKATWAEAVNAAGNGGSALMTLARMAAQWGWNGEAAEVLWQAVTKSNRSSEALSALCAFYYARRDTAGLYRAYSLLAERNPNDNAARNNLVIFSLLLDKDKGRALNTARELYEKEPANPVYASTYAFALYCLDKNAQALEVMQKLKPEELRTPSLAAYYSAFLAAAGRTDEAREYRELARGATLLPEEAQSLNLPQEPEKADAAAISQSIPSPIMEATPPPLEQAAQPAAQPSATPSAEPAATPAAESAPQPSAEPAAQPAATPSAEPAATPSPEPVAESLAPSVPMQNPAEAPVAEPTATPAAASPGEQSAQPSAAQ